TCALPILVVMATFLRPRARPRRGLRSPRRSRTARTPAPRRRSVRRARCLPGRRIRVRARWCDSRRSDSHLLPLAAQLLDIGGVERHALGDLVLAAADHAPGHVAVDGCEA